MRLVVLGLSVTSAWGNGHATTWRALLAALAARGHDILFLERDVPWYAAHRDLPDPPFCRLALYRDLDGLARHHAAVAGADAVILGSFVPEGVAVARHVLAAARGTVAFYDIDTPVTLGRLARGDHAYIAPDLIPRFDLYLSFTGGPMLEVLRHRWGARATGVLHCAVDEALYRPDPAAAPRWDLSYLGTYAEDRQPALERLLIDPARRAPRLRVCVAGAQYPDDIAWPANVERIEHVAPGDHPAFYAASRFTLNITRAEMVRAGHSPSVRLFEAGACATPVISDDWPGLAQLFAPGEEILICERPEQVLAALTALPEARRQAIARAARARVLAAHTAAHRAADLERLLRAHARQAAPA